jgi:putative resolvase
MSKTVKYVNTKAAVEILGVHRRTLYLWEKKGKIDTIRSAGGKRLYNVGKYIKTQKSVNDVNYLGGDEVVDERINVSYVRVSSKTQSDDLARQIKMVIKAYPDNKIIKDIGSGLNYNKPGLKKLIELAIDGKIKTLVIAHKDRLVRFGYEMIESLIKTYSGGKIIIINKKEDVTKEQEMVEDILQIMNVYVAKMNRMRKYIKH